MMNLFLSIVLFLGGVLIVVYFAEKLVKGVVGTSLAFGLSPFLLSVIFVGFDPENLAVGATGSFEGVAGIALGSVVGAAMVAIALAFGITALIAPMSFERAPKQVLAVPVAATLVFAALCLDGRLSRVDGMLLLVGFTSAVVYLLRLSKRGLDIKPTGEIVETLEEGAGLSKWRSLGLMLLSLAAIILGSEMIVTGADTIIARLGLSDTVFGMTILALLVSIEELARELPAALKGRSDISYGNVAGSVLAFFLFNAGIIAIVHPVPVAGTVINFYIPVCLGSVIVVSLFMTWMRVPRWAGGVLVALYLVFFVGGYVLV